MREHTLIAYIYSLTDPRDASVGYVGQSIEPIARYRQHVAPATWQAGRRRLDWQEELAEVGQRPTLRILACVPASEALHHEQQWIDRLRAEGAMLTNRPPADQRTGVDCLIGPFPSDLWRQVKTKAAAEGISIRSLILGWLANYGGDASDHAHLMSQSKPTTQTDEREE